MIKLNLALDRPGKRLLVFGFSQENLRRLRQDDPIWFDGESIAMPAAGRVLILYVRDVGHFLSKVGPSLDLPEEGMQTYIDLYRQAIKEKAAHRWVCWATGVGVTANTGEKKPLITGLFVEEVLAGMEGGNQVTAGAECWGLAPGSEMVLFCETEPGSMETTVIDEILPKYHIMPQLIEALRVQFSGNDNSGTLYDEAG